MVEKVSCSFAHDSTLRGGSMAGVSGGKSSSVLVLNWEAEMKLDKSSKHELITQTYRFGSTSCFHCHQLLSKRANIRRTPEC